MYGSSLRPDTARPRALRSRPTEAAVIPLPREEVTPPVTKTYFAIARFSSGVFPILRRSSAHRKPVALIGLFRRSADARATVGARLQATRRVLWVTSATTHACWRTW